jgi:uncharacterized protein (DUF1499 family)
MRQFMCREFATIICVSSIVFIGCGKSITGIQDGRLMPCPSSPNCVSSYETDASHSIDALTYKGSRENAQKAVLSILTEMPAVKIITSEDGYIHAEFRSRIFQFVDDVEFQFLETPRVIHMRSSSRVGYSDLGVNKKRMAQIRSLFYEKTGVEASEKQ